MSKVFSCYAAQLGWMALCVFIAFDQTWQTAPALDDFLWHKEWLAYIGLFIVFIYGRSLILTLFDAKD